MGLPTGIHSIIICCSMLGALDTAACNDVRHAACALQHSADAAAGFASATAQVLSGTVAIPLAFTAVLEHISRSENGATALAEDTAHQGRSHGRIRKAGNRIHLDSAPYPLPR